jgi:hypothetical protein
LVHPYTGEAQNLSEAVALAEVRLLPFGRALVTDFEVEGANHYISFGGFVNKNTRVYVEEVTNFPTPRPINLLRATLRSAAGVPCGMRLTGNPGGPGHTWVKARYITPDKRGWRVIAEEYDVAGKKQTLERIFIPSKLSDNPLLMLNDPTYVLKLQQVGSKQLVRAWLEGDWEAVEGAFFSEFDYNVHVLPMSWQERIPLRATRFRSFDWGSSKPFCCGWYVLSDGTWGLPADALLKYREWYGSNGQPNQGLKMDAKLVAQGIKERERGELIRFGVADPSIFIKDGGPSIFELMAVGGTSWRRADNKRVAGWEQLHWRFRGHNYGTVDWQPMLYFLECCEDSIRTIPVLQHDEVKAEDVDTDGEDHAGDETRYACMARPSHGRQMAEEARYLPKLPSEYTINELVEQRRNRRIATEQME